MTNSSNSTQFPELYGISFSMLDQHGITKLRKRMGLSQSEMAETLGVASRYTVSQWERGATTPGGPVMRFLSLLASLSEADLRKIIKNLEKITKEEASS